MGMHDLVATDFADYAAIGKRLVCDDAYRLQIRQRVRDAAGVLFEDVRAITGWESVLQQAVLRRVAALKAKLWNATTVEVSAEPVSQAPHLSPAAVSV
jgi:hypothetical protein